jgi:hypothetical protein
MLRAALIAPFIWAACFLFRIIFIITGPFFVATALLCKAYYSEFNKYKGNNGDPVYIFSWKIMAPWQNYSDGFYCTTYFDYGFFWTSMVWSCYRNPTGGLRWAPIYSVKPEPTKVQYVGSYSKADVQKYKNKTEAHWWYCWQGFYSGLLVQFNVKTPSVSLRPVQFKVKNTLLRLWLGHKLDPRDTEGVDPTDYRVDGAAFTSRIKSV